AIISTIAAATARRTGSRSVGSLTRLQSTPACSASAIHCRARRASRLTSASTRSRSSTVGFPEVVEGILGFQFPARHEVRLDLVPDRYALAGDFRQEETGVADVDVVAPGAKLHGE